MKQRLLLAELRDAAVGLGKALRREEEVHVDKDGATVELREPPATLLLAQLLVSCYGLASAELKSFSEDLFEPGLPDPKTSPDFP